MNLLNLRTPFGFAGSGSIEPLPFDDFRFVDAVFERVIAASYLIVPELVFGVSAQNSDPGHAIDCGDRNSEAANLVTNRMLKSNGVLMLHARGNR